MIYAIPVILVLLNLLFVFKKKYGKFFAFLLLFFMWILFWANTKNPDYVWYVTTYNAIQSGTPVFDGKGAEVGYRILMKLGTLLGFSYEVYLSIIIFCSYLLIHSTVRKFCQNYNYIYILYFVFPFFLDVVQIRNFIAMSLFIYAVKYLYDNSIKSKIKYVILILLASSVHYAAILYLPMILIGIRKKNYLIRAIVLFSILTSVIILVNNKQIPYINELIANIFNNEKLIAVFKTRTHLGFLLFWFMQTASFLMMLYSQSMIKKNINDDMYFKNGSIKSIELNAIGPYNPVLFVELVFWINLMAFMYLPFYIVASTFTRLMRNILLLNYISFAIVSGNIRRPNQRLLFNILVVIYVLFFFIFELYIPYREVILETILINNSLIGLK